MLKNSGVNKTVDFLSYYIHANVGKYNNMTKKLYLPEINNLEDLVDFKKFLIEDKRGLKIL